MTKRPCTVWIGFDPRESDAYAVARSSIRRFRPTQKIHGLVLSDLQIRNLYFRPTKMILGRLWDEISGAHMSTEFAVSRFLVPTLVRRMYPQPFGWALFMDCDVLVRANLNELFELLDDEKAVMCVKHDHQPDNEIKMYDQVQTRYPRKNWSSVMAFNCDHPSNYKLDIEMVNTLPGRDLHGFCWLEDHEIGELPPEWNYLVGHTDLRGEPKIVHFTDGIPSINAFRECEYAGEWFMELERWAA